MRPGSSEPPGLSGMHPNRVHVCSRAGARARQGLSRHDLRCYDCSTMIRTPGPITQVFDATNTIAGRIMSSC